MAKGLKSGDTVSVTKTYKFKRASDIYKSGLHRVQPGDVGKVVDAAKGRSVMVDFKGQQFPIASQRLQRVEPPPEPRRRGRRPGSTNKAKAAVETAPAQQEMGDIAFVNYNDAQFVRKVANTLLMHGAAQTDPEAVVVQIKLSELPQPVQAQIRELMQAKLALGLQQPSAQPKRRGRPPKNQSK
jgi:hypothetical protein